MDNRNLLSARTDPALVSIREMNMARDGKTILNGISFDLALGEILVILGPSGSGKSSLLRCLNRLESNSGGEILFEGRETRTLRITELRRKIGMVFQIPSLPPATVRENVGTGPRLHGEVLTGEDCATLLNRVGLGSTFAERQVESLSVGEKQRVALAMALANHPSVLLLDEPTSALDPTAVLTIENLIKSIHQRLNTATLLVTHDLNQALRFNATTLLLHEGRIIAKGNIQEMMRHPSDERVRRFFQGELSEANPERPPGAKK